MNEWKSCYYTMKCDRYFILFVSSKFVKHFGYMYDELLVLLTEGNSDFEIALPIKNSNVWLKVDGFWAPSRFIVLFVFLLHFLLLWSERVALIWRISPSRGRIVVPIIRIGRGRTVPRGVGWFARGLCWWRGRLFD